MLVISIFFKKKKISLFLKEKMALPNKDVVHVESLMKICYSIVVMNHYEHSEILNWVNI